MTLYAFRCRSCNQDIEAFYELGRAPDEITCDCNALARRLPSRGTFAAVPGAHNTTYKR